MDALHLLQNRTSTPALSAPAPSATQLEQMFLAAARAPDHGALKPYRFLTIEGAGLERLGQLYLKAAMAKTPDLSEAAQERFIAMPLRAPMIVVAIAVKTEHPKVPFAEQVMTAACATHGLIQAAYAMGVGAMWRTGDITHDSLVRSGLGVQAHEEIIGFVYMGTPTKLKETPSVDTSSWVSQWPQEA